MGAFEYTAVDAGGKERRGILEGDTVRIRDVEFLYEDEDAVPENLEELTVGRKK